METRNTLKRVLVPLDGSEAANRTLAHVEQLLRAAKAEALPLMALPRPVAGDADGAIIAAVTSAEDYLKGAVHRLQKAGIHARRLLVPGPPASAILDAAAREDADLIVMGTHGHSVAFTRFVLGSVTDKVVQASRVPVLIVPSGAEAPPAFRRILVPFDGSAFSLQVAPVVKALAKALDARVHLVHVLEPHWEGVTWAVPERPMKDAANGFIEACLPTTVEIRKGDPASQILEAAAEQDAGLIAMATHGRSGPARWALGSVTEKVLRAAKRPLLIVRARQE